MHRGEATWVLLVEDDPIFAMLFCRFWRERAGAAELVVAKNLCELRQALEGRCAPSLVILDRNLPDGDGHEVAAEADWPSHCWSSVGDGAAGAKPVGKQALLEAIEELLERVHCLPSEGRASDCQE